MLAYPCNNFFSQEPGTNEDVWEFVQTKNVNFVVFGKLECENGSSTHPLFLFLRNSLGGGILGKQLKWNYTKFLVDANGIPIKRSGDNDMPMDMEKDIQALLAMELPTEEEEEAADKDKVASSTTDGNEVVTSAVDQVQPAVAGVIAATSPPTAAVPVEKCIDSPASPTGRADVGTNVPTDISSCVPADVPASLLANVPADVAAEAPVCMDNVVSINPTKAGTEVNAAPKPASL